MSEIFAKPVRRTIEAWEGFAVSRNLVLHKATFSYQLKPEDWLFMIDADDVVDVWEPVPTDTKHAGFYVRMRGDYVTYPRIQVFRVGAGWHYIGVVHEYPECGAPAGTVGNLGTIVHSTRDGARNLDPNKYLNDARLLVDALTEGVNDPLLERRYTFYLAQSYRDAGEAAAASEAYWRRSEMGGYKDEVYISILEGMRLKYAFDGFDDMDEPDGLTDRLKKAQELCPQRRECVWQMMRWLREHRRWSDVIMLYLRYPPCAPEMGTLFLELRAYDYGMHDEAGVAYYYLGDFASSLKASLTALSVYPDMKGDIKRIIDNLYLAHQRL